MQKFISFLLICAILCTTCLAAPAAPEIPAPSAVLMERDTGKILYEKDPHKKLPPASVTKVMTLLLVMEALESGKISMNDMVTVSPHAASMGGSQVFLEPGEQMSMDDMLKATVIASGNDSSVALAEHVAGSEEGFVAMMNAKAKELNMNDTNFANCTGLDVDGHVTSAHDIAIMSCELLKHDKIKKYANVWMDSLRNGAFQLANTNKLLRSYNGITGLKTGFTSTAKYCMAASAERDGMELVAAIMAAPTSQERFSAASTLLDYGFANFALFDGSEKFTPSDVAVLLGVEKTVSTKLADSAKLLVEKGMTENIKTSVELCENVKAPVEINQKLGSFKILKDDEILEEIPILSSVSVKRQSTFNIFWQMLSQCFMK